MRNNFAIVLTVMVTTWCVGCSQKPPATDIKVVTTSAPSSTSTSSTTNACPTGMVSIPPPPAGGTAHLGPYEGMAGSAHDATIHALCMDRTEVTVAEYRKCFASGKCKDTWPPKLKGKAMPRFWQQEKEGCADVDVTGGATLDGRHPMNCVTWDDARAFCEWKGGRLPTEDEWEWAARGSDGRVYPWGNESPVGRVCEVDNPSRSSCEVGSFPKGASPFGILDMSGNVWEWTENEAAGGSAGASHNSHIVRGGPAINPPGQSHRIEDESVIRATYRSAGESEDRLGMFGFRCVTNR